jgi:hypothetical protein
MISTVLPITFALTHGVASGAGLASCTPRKMRSNDTPSGV